MPGWASAPGGWEVENDGDCALGQTTTARPDSSGAKHSGIIVGLTRPTTATTSASRVIARVVATRTLRKLRTRSCSRSAAELAARTAVTILPRSSSTARVRSSGSRSLESGSSGWSGSLTPTRRAMRSSSWRRGSVGTRWHCACRSRRR